MIISVRAFPHAVMAHCRERGDEMLVGDLSHMHVFEQGGSAQVSASPESCTSSSSITQNLMCMCVFFCLLEQLAGVHSTTLHTLSDGTFNLDERVKDPPRLPKVLQHSVAPHMFGEHAQHTGRTRASSVLPAGGL